MVGLSYRQSLYAHAGINVWYSVMSIYGWWRWSATHSEGRFTQTDAPAWRITLILMLSAWTVFSYLPFWLGLTPLKFLDVLSSSIAVGAMYLMSLRHTEHWLLWILANSMFTYLFYTAGYPLVAAQYLIFILMAVWGWRSWLQMEVDYQHPKNNP